MNYMTRSLQISCLFHALLLLALIGLGDRFISSERRMVVDFTLEDPIILSGLKSRAISKNQEQAPKAAEAAKMEKQDLAEPKAANIVQKEASAPVAPGVQKISAVDAQTTIPSTKETKAVGEEKAADNVASEHRSYSEGVSILSQDRGVKTASTGQSENVQDSGGVRYLKANFSYIKDMINRKLEYPKTARKMGWEGQVRISFTILANGDSRDIRVIRGSGREMLDRNAVEAVRNASPFPRPPVEAQIIVPIVYRLN